MEPQIVGAIIGGAVAMGVAVIGVAANVAYRRLEAKLRGEVDLQIQAARGNIERDLKVHEVRLRIAAETRLKMLELMLHDAAEFRRALGTAIGATTLLAHEAVPNGSSPRARELLLEAQRAFAQLSGAGPFMPATLLTAATEVANEFQDALRDVVDWSNLSDRAEREERCKKTNEAMTATSSRSKVLFSRWQAAQFETFTQALEGLEPIPTPKLPSVTAPL